MNNETNNQSSECEHYRFAYEKFRRSGIKFAEKYPDMANSLLADSASYEDPNIEALLQAMAYMHSCDQMLLDEVKTKLHEELMQSVQPRIQTVLPSLAILQVDLQTNELLPLSHGSQLKFKTENETYHYRVCGDHSLRPIKLSCKINNNTLSVLLVSNSDCPLSVHMQEIPLLITLKHPEAIKFHALLRHGLKALRLKVGDEVIACETEKHLRFDQECNFSIYPYHGSSNNAFQQLQSFLNYPQAYYRFSLIGLDSLVRESVHTCQLDFIFTDDKLLRSLDPDRIFAINAFAVINLYAEAGPAIAYQSDQLTYTIESEFDRDQLIDMKQLLAFHPNGDKLACYRDNEVIPITQNKSDSIIWRLQNSSNQKFEIELQNTSLLNAASNIILQPEWYYTQLSTLSIEGWRKAVIEFESLNMTACSPQLLVCPTTLKTLNQSSLSQLATLRLQLLDFKNETTLREHLNRLLNCFSDSAQLITALSITRQFSAQQIDATRHILPRFSITIHFNQLYQDDLILRNLIKRYLEERCGFGFVIEVC